MPIYFNLTYSTKHNYITFLFYNTKISDNTVHTIAIGNCMVKLIPPVNFCSDENILTILGTKFEDFLNYRTEYNSIS
jgi:hypothetical protein